MNTKIIQNYSKIAAVASLLLVQAGLMVSDGKIPITYIGFGLLWAIYFALDLIRGSSHHTFSTYSLCTALLSVFFGLLVLAWLPQWLDPFDGNPTIRIATRVIGIEADLMVLAAFAIAVRYLSSVKLKVVLLALMTGFVLLVIVSDLSGDWKFEFRVRRMILPALMITNAVWLFMVAYGRRIWS